MSAAPLYAFCGPEIGQRNDALRDLRAALQKKAGQLDSHVFYAADGRIADMVSLLQNVSLFADLCFVELRNAELIKKKEDIELIGEWLSGAGPSSALALVSDEISLDRKLETLVPKEQKKVFWELFEDRKESWLRAFFQREGFSIEDEAVRSILELVENNTESLRTECSRFFACFEKGRRLTQDDVENLLSHNREESAFTLFDSLADAGRPPAARLENALAILQKLRLSKDSSGVQLIAGLTYAFRRLADWLELHKNAWPSEYELKTKGFTSKKAQTQYRKAQKIWDAPSCARILALLSKTDFQLRSGGAALENTYLYLLLYSIVFKNGVPVDSVA